MGEENRAADQRSLRRGSTSQGFLLTMIGDYWFGQPMYIPSAAIVALLSEFGITPQASRAALSRVQRAGYLIGERDGRRTLYRLSPESAGRALASGRRIMRFTNERPDGPGTWDQRWTIVTYSLSTDHVDERRELRRVLRSLGFGPVQDAVWISPRTSAAAVERELDPVHRGAITIFERADLAETSALDVARIWGLPELAARYRAIIDQLGSMLPKVRSPTPPTAHEALVMRSEAMQEWRKMPAIDPRLPTDLLPEDWPGWEARRLFAEVYDQLGPLAADRVREVVAPHSEVVAAAVHHYLVGGPTPP